MTDSTAKGELTMKLILKAAVLGAVLATAVFFIPFLIPLLLAIFVIRLLAWLAFGRYWGGPKSRRAHWAMRQQAWDEQVLHPVPIDGISYGPESLQAGSGPARNVALA